MWHVESHSVRKNVISKDLIEIDKGTFGKLAWINTMKKWKEMRLKFLKRCWFSCKAFPLYSPVQTEIPQQVWNGAPFTFRTVALYRKWRTNEKSRWRLLQKSKLEPYSVEWPGKIFRSHA